jgi:hypothetical protein
LSAAETDAVVAELARSAVERAAPEELPLFPATSEAYFADPSAAGRAGGRDEMLGFGVEAAAMLVTPVALQVAREVFDFVAAHLRKRAQEQSGEAIDGAVARLLHRDKNKGEEVAAPPELTDEQLEQVRTLALEKARMLRLPQAKAELLADSLVGSLATA